MSVAREAGDKYEEAVSLRNKAFNLGRLGRHEEAIKAADRSASLARELGNKFEQAISLRYKAANLGRLRRNEEAIEVADEALLLAREAGNKYEESVSLRNKVGYLRRSGRFEEAVTAADAARLLSQEIRDKRGEADSLRLKSYDLGELSRHEEAVQAATTGASLAREVADGDIEIECLYRKAFNLNSLSRHSDALAVADAAMAAARAAENTHFMLWLGREILKAAKFVERADAVSIFEELMRHVRDKDHRPNGVVSELPRPEYALRDVFLSATRALAFDALDELIERHADALLNRATLMFFVPSDGEVIARVAAADGRASGFEAARGLISRIASFMDRLDPERRDKNWLPVIISGFAGACRDPGLLRDVADWLPADIAPQIAPQAAESAALLRLLADMDEAEDPEHVLARADPDRAVLARRLRGLPDPEPTPPKRTSRKG